MEHDRTRTADAVLFFTVPAIAAAKLDRLILPPGFQVALSSDRVPNAREIASGVKGTVFAGSMGVGKVIVCEPPAAGFRRGEAGWDRPADVQARSDDSAFIGDDPVGAVYHPQARYAPAKPVRLQPPAPVWRHHAATQ